MIQVIFRELFVRVIDINLGLFVRVIDINLRGVEPRVGLYKL